MSFSTEKTRRAVVAHDLRRRERQQAAARADRRAGVEGRHAAPRARRARPQQRGRWNTTVANAWGVVALGKFSARFEATPVTGTTTAATLGDAAFTHAWQPDDGSKTFAQRLAVAATRRESVGARAGRHRRAVGDAAKHRGDPAEGAAVERLSHHAHASRRSSSRRPGEWRRGDVARVTLDVDAQADMTWVVVDDPIPAGAPRSAAASAATRRSPRRASSGRARCGPRSRSARSTRFARTYRYVPKGTLRRRVHRAPQQPGRVRSARRRASRRCTRRRCSAKLPNARVDVCWPMRRRCFIVALARACARPSPRAWPPRSPTCSPACARALRHVRRAAARPPRRAASRACASSATRRRLAWTRSPTSRPRCKPRWSRARTSASTSTPASTGPGSRSPRGTARGAPPTAAAPRGGSTLTMQLAGLLDPALRAERRRAAHARAEVGPDRGGAARSSARGPRRRSSRRISTSRRFAASSTACGAAAHGLFGKAPSGLDAREVGDPGGAAARARARGPRSSRSARARSLPQSRRRCRRARRSARKRVGGAGRRLSHAASCERSRRISRRSSCKRPASGLSTTLDARAAGVRDRDACAIICAELAGARRARTARIVVLDNATGDVLAYVGSSGELSRAPRGRRRDRAAAGGLDAEAVPVRARDRRPRAHRGLARRRQPARDRHRARRSTCRRTTTATSTARSACAPRSRARSTCRRCARSSSSASARLHDDLRALGFDTLTRDAATTTAPRSRSAART